MFKKRDKSSLFLDVAVFLFACIAVAALLLAFATPYWYRADPNVVSAFLPGNAPDAPGVWIDSFGLWMYCYRRPDYDQRRYWDYSIACRSYYTNFFVNVRLPAFFVAVQVLYTIGVGIACIILLLLFGIVCCCGRNRTLIAISGSVLSIAAIFISIALIVFASSTSDLRGGARVGLFGSLNQDSYWSFWVAVGGLCLLWISALACLIEVFLIQRREELEDLPEQIYTDHLLD